MSNNLINKPIFVTKPFLAPLEDFIEILKGVWERGVLTHNGPLLQQLERNLEDKLGVRHFTVVSNGTIAIQMAIKALELKGEIITTPFTYIATVSAIKWENCVPIFCDIDPDTLNIDPSKIESLINENTVAIMPVHVFGNPCNVEEIEMIAKKHNLKVIYDGAHAIGSTYKSESVLNWGDITTASLHATKLLNTGEGGGCITTDEATNERLRSIRFFGHDNDKDITIDGFNGKLNEINAALGLANLKYYDDVLAERKRIYLSYRTQLQNLKNVKFQKINDDEINYSYFPIIFESCDQLLSIEKELNDENFYPRRYFYPSVNTYRKIVDYKECPISENIAERILCLPLYYGLEDHVIQRICEIIKHKIN